MRTLWDAGRVTRYHTVQTLQRQTIADHQWGVAMILYQICINAPSQELIRAALQHDLAEVITGDAPATAKWTFPDVKKAMDDAEAHVNNELGLIFSLTPEETLLLKAADMLELCYFCLNETALGNSKAQDVLERGLKYVLRLHPQGQTPFAILKLLKDFDEHHVHMTCARDWEDYAYD